MLLTNNLDLFFLAFIIINLYIYFLFSHLSFSEVPFIMADDDDKPKKHTLESLFHLYANYNVISFDLDNIVYDCILLSQIDYWLDQAKLLKTTFSLTETGLTYMKFRYKIC